LEQNNKIIFYLPDLRIGGAERVFVNLANYFLEKGFDVSFLLNKRKGGFLDFINVKIPIYALEDLYGNQSIISIIKFFQNNRFKLVFACLGSSVRISLLYLFFKSKGTIVINRLGNTVTQEYKYLTWKKKIKYLIAQNLIGLGSDLIIFQSFYMKSDFYKISFFNKKNGIVIYNPVNALLINSSLKEKISKSVEFDFIAVGRLMMQKDYPTMLLAIRHLVDEGYSNIKLGIVGGGEQELYLRKLTNDLKLSDNIVFLGIQSNPYQFIVNSKLLVSSSIYEGFSNAILEALILNVPVVATDCPSGLSEFFKEGYHGYLAKVGDQKSLAINLLKALKNLEQLKKKGFSLDIQNKFSEDIIGDEYIKIVKPYLMN
jgi:glycosyltransferase involved in cell wall biosynthesis